MPMFLEKRRAPAVPSSTREMTATNMADRLFRSNLRKRIKSLASICVNLRRVGTPAAALEGRDVWEGLPHAETTKETEFPTSKGVNRLYTMAYSKQQNSVEESSVPRVASRP